MKMKKQKRKHDDYNPGLAGKLGQAFEFDTVLTLEECQEQLMEANEQPSSINVWFPTKIHRQPRIKITSVTPHSASFQINRNLISFGFVEGRLIRTATGTHVIGYAPIFTLINIAVLLHCIMGVGLLLLSIIFTTGTSFYVMFLITFIFISLNSYKVSRKLLAIPRDILGDEASKRKNKR